MAHYVDLHDKQAVVLPDGKTPAAGQLLVDPLTATSCGLRHGQPVTSEQIQALRDGSVDTFKSLTAHSTPAPSAEASKVSDVPRPEPVPAIVASSSDDSGGVLLTGVLAFGVWVWAAWSSVMQKQRADRLISDAWDISAVQIQQLNGQVTAHAVMAIAVAFAASVPLVIAIGLRGH